jgi:cyclin-dependent kinase
LLSLQSQRELVIARTHGSDINNNDEPVGETIDIGVYTNCKLFDSGVTSEVYHCKTKALKVIVNPSGIAPHNPTREAKILESLKHPNIIPLLETFRDREQQLVLVFPFMPLTLGSLLNQGSVTQDVTRRIFSGVLSALEHLHGQGIVHRDIKPSAVLLESPTGPAYLSDFGTAWHPSLSLSNEPADQKILDIGTGSYRAPEVLFGNKSYGPPVDMWGVGTMLAECCREPPEPLFKSPPVYEDGNQLGLILSIFKTLGTPTLETWPEAAHFRTPPFEIYQIFEPHDWREILPSIDSEFLDLISKLVRYDDNRATAQQVCVALVVASPPRLHIMARLLELFNIN